MNEHLFIAGLLDVSYITGTSEIDEAVAHETGFYV